MIRLKKGYVSSAKKKKKPTNKSDRATMRPDCVLACIDFEAKYLCDIYGDTDGQTDEASCEGDSQNVFVDH